MIFIVTRVATSGKIGHDGSAGVLSLLQPSSLHYITPLHKTIFIHIFEVRNHIFHMQLMVTYSSIGLT